MKWVWIAHFAKIRLIAASLSWFFLEPALTLAARRFASGGVEIVAIIDGFVMFWISLYGVVLRRSDWESL